MTFLLEQSFPGMKARTDSIHLETSFALEKENNDDFSLIWVKRPRTIKK